MSAPTLPLRERILYPDSDGEPMAENTLQFEYIVTIKEGLDARFRDVADVFIAGDLFWYPEKGHPEIRRAPDTLAVFGRPKGHRGSYKQWEEEGIAPQVTFEVMSPSNRRAGELLRKFEFYERYGVEEYYIYDPDYGTLEGWRRIDGKLREIDDMNGWVSPRLGVRFELVNGDLKLFGPDGRPFLTYGELVRQWEEEQQRAELERQAREQAQRRAEEAQHQAEQAQQLAERLAAQLRALGQEPLP